MSLEGRPTTSRTSRTERGRERRGGREPFDPAEYRKGIRNKLLAAAGALAIGGGIVSMDRGQSAPSREAAVVATPDTDEPENKRVLEVRTSTPVQAEPQPVTIELEDGEEFEYTPISLSGHELEDAGITEDGFYDFDSRKEDIDDPDIDEDSIVNAVEPIAIEELEHEMTGEQLESMYATLDGVSVETHGNLVQVDVPGLETVTVQLMTDGMNSHLMYTFDGVQRILSSKIQGSYTDAEMQHGVKNLVQNLVFASMDQNQPVNSDK